MWRNRQECTGGCALVVDGEGLDADAVACVVQRVTGLGPEDECAAARRMVRAAPAADAGNDVLLTQRERPHLVFHLESVFGMSQNMIHLYAESWTQKVRISLYVSDTVVMTAWYRMLRCRCCRHLHSCAVFDSLL